MILFNHLSASNLIDIAKKELERNEQIMEKTYHIHFENEEPLPTTILYMMGGKTDARNTTAGTRKYFYQEFYELLRLIDSKMGENALSRRERHH